MPDSTCKIRRAAKEHRCSEHGHHVIKAGDLYLYAAAPPWHDANCSRRWWIIKACLRCADGYGLHTSDTRKQLAELQNGDGLPPLRGEGVTK